MMDALEGYLGKYSITVSHTQLAIQICLEVLGARLHPIPVIVPVTASPDTLSAVLRAGAQPLLLDINPDTKQLDETALQSALEALESAVVVLTRPGGHPVASSLLELVQEVPTVVDTRLVPHPQLDTSIDLCGSFNVFDLSSLIGSGSVIFHKYDKQIQMIRTIRSGVMGHNGDLPSLLCSEMMSWTHALGKRKEAYEDVYAAYTKSTSLPVWAKSVEPSPVIVEVANARLAKAHLDSYNVKAELGLCCLHELDEVKRRYTKGMPDYPNAEALSNRVLALPFESSILGQEANIMKWLEEIQ